MHYLKIVMNALILVTKASEGSVPLPIEINVNAKAQGLIGVDLFNG
jgi:hypothetical protein